MNNKDSVLCPFCNKPDFKHQIALENKYFFVLVARSYLVPGHVIIVPKKHAPDLKVLSNESSVSLIKLLDKIMKIEEKIFKANGFNVLSNIGREAGQTIGHFHLHLFPRSKREKYNPLEAIFNRKLIKGRKPSPKDIEQIVRKIKRAIK